MNKTICWLTIWAVAATPACSTTTTTPPQSTPATEVSSGVAPSAGTYLAAADVDAQQKLAAATPPAQSVINTSAAGLGLKPTEAACLAQHLDAHPDLRDALGDNPAVSPRYQDLAAASQECIRITTGATNFANSIAAQTGGTLPVETLNCLRDAWAKLPAEQTGALIQAALNPGTTDPNAQNTIDTILTQCHISRNQLNTAQTR